MNKNPIEVIIFESLQVITNIVHYTGILIYSYRSNQDTLQKKLDQDQHLHILERSCN